MRDRDPFVDLFFSDLSVTPARFSWGLTEAGAIRAHADGAPDTRYCPITAVARYVTGKFYDVHEIHEAGRRIGLTKRQIVRLGDAADNFTEGQSSAYRAEMLNLLGLTGEEETE